MSVTPSHDNSQNECTWRLNSETTSDLLASSAWQRINPGSRKGVIRRLQMMEEDGLPPMRVISAKTLQKLGRIPRSTERDEKGEKYTEDALDVISNTRPNLIGASPVIIFFFSHRWLRPSYCEEEEKDLMWGTDDYRDAIKKGYVVGYPDSSNDEKANALIEYVSWFKAQLRNQGSSLFNFCSKAKQAEIYFWIDFCCVDQTNPGPDMKALPAYAAVSSGILSYFSHGYEDRAWCRAELMLSNSFMTTGDTVFVLPRNFKYEGLSIDDPPREMDFKVPDPLSGDITNNDDWETVRSLHKAASESAVFSCWRSFVNNSLMSPWVCFYLNVCCLCQGFGMCTWLFRRSVGPGKGCMKKIIPKPYAKRLRNGR